MNEIDITDGEGRTPLGICRAQREWLVSRYKAIELIALKYFIEDAPVAEGDKNTDEKAIKHIRQCPKCREWFHRVTPEATLRRQSRLARYCCAGMFVAVEEFEGDNRNRIEFELFRGEDPCWKVDGIRTFASYCPWCGKKLPDKPFIEEETPNQAL